MVQAIGAAAPAAPDIDNGAGRAAGLLAQLARAQQQLSDCTNCDSAKTAQGKADIERIAARIADIERQLAADTPAAAAAAPDRSSPASKGQIGSQIDLFA